MLCISQSNANFSFISNHCVVFFYHVFCKGYILWKMFKKSWPSVYTRVKLKRHLYVQGNYKNGTNGMDIQVIPPKIYTFHIVNINITRPYSQQWVKHASIEPVSILILRWKTRSVAPNFSKTVMTFTGNMMEFKIGSSAGPITSIHTAASSVLSSEGTSAATYARGNICHRESTNSA